MNNFLLTVAALVLLAIGALFAVPPMIDWNQYRGVFEEEVSRIFGREVRVGGDVHLRILPMPYVSFQQVRIADAPGISGPFVRAEHFTLWLSVPPLLRGVVEARKIEIKNPEVRLRLNDTGGGNWQTLRPREYALPFVPKQIELQSVNIRNGKLTLENSGGVRLASVERIYGELSAEALAGPYKFVGTVGVGHAGQHELRVSTAPADADGAIRIALASHSRSSPASLAIEGALAQGDHGPTFAGSLKLRAPLVAPPPETSADASGRVIELNATVKSSTQRVDVSDLSVTFDSGGRPQRLQGNAHATWDDGIILRGQLASRWLDLDALFGVTPDAGPLPAIHRFIGRNPGALLPGQTVFDISVDQANLAGDSISNLRTRWGYSGTSVSLDRIQAELPGGAHLNGDGTVIETKDGPVVAGHIILAGRNLRRFAGWAKIPFADLTGQARGAFALRGDLQLGAGRAVLTNATAHLAHARLEGSVTYNWSEPRLSVAAEVNDLDLSGFGKDLLALDALQHLAGLEGAKTKPTAPAWPSRWAKIPLTAELHGARVTDGQRTLKSFDVHIVRDNNLLQVKRARFALASGVTADLSGAVKLGATPVEGRLEGQIGATSPAGAEALFGVLGNVFNAKALTGHLRSAAPMRMAFTARFGDDGGRTAIEADGQVRRDRVWLSARTDGSIEAWRSQRLQLAINVSGPDARATTAWLRPDAVWPAAVARVDASPLNLRLRIRGVPLKGMRATAAVDSTMLGASATAELRLAGDDTLTWTGHLNVNSADVLQAAGVFAPGLAKLAGSVPLTGKIDINRTAKQLEIRPNGLRLGPSSLQGRITVAGPRKAGGPARIDADVELDQADAADLLTALLSRRTVPSASDSSATESAPEFWSDQPFDLSGLARVAGPVKLSVDRLTLAPGLNLDRVEIAAVVRPDGISVSQLEAHANGGAVTATASLEQAAAGVMLTLTAAGRKLPIARFAPGEVRNRFAGTADMTLSLKGQALSPRAMAANMRGTGTLTLTAAAIPGIGPARLSELANRVVAAEIDPKDLTEQIGDLVRQEMVRLPAMKVALEVGDGAIRIGDLTWSEGDVRATNTTTVDIIQWAVDSQWQIWPNLKPTAEVPAPKPLPPVQIVNVGPLATLAETDPRIAAGSLQRELTVRRMEADVARLERLRREDDERARVEKERLQRLEQERRKAIEAERLRRLQESERNRVPGAAPGPATTPPPARSTPGKVERAPLPPPGTTGSVPPRASVAPPAIVAPVPQPGVIRPPVPPPSTASPNAVKPGVDPSAPQRPGRIADRPNGNRPAERRRETEAFDRNRILDPRFNDNSH
jgi:uncharacterized protein involved in outer membrane biogenesis